MTLDSWAAVATIVGSVIAVGVVMLGVLKLWIRQVVAEQKLVRSDTAQLQHNGGSHVADYARDARDASIRTDAKIDELSEKLTEHLIQSAAKHAGAEGKIEILSKVLKP